MLINKIILNLSNLNNGAMIMLNRKIINGVWNEVNETSGGIGK
jgi:hypothetical protein|tara:strand:- start:200 stop:328 length:129 start_codon:yes stop_codon:yes gene_type:complete